MIEAVILTRVRSGSLACGQRVSWDWSKEQPQQPYAVISSYYGNVLLAHDGPVSLREKQFVVTVFGPDSLVIRQDLEKIRTLLHYWSTASGGFTIQKCIAINESGIQFDAEAETYQGSITFEISYV